MKSQLYIPEETKEYLKAEITDYVEIYFQKLLKVFEDIENEADKKSTEFYNNFMNMPAYDDYIDPASIAEKALEIGIEHYSYLKLGKYHLIATWHATLYQLWEQQSRLFLFREMSHVRKIDFKAFCAKGSINEIKEKFQFHNVVIEKFSCWHKIDELRLLCNVIKHGNGSSANELRDKNPELFKKPDLFNKEIQMIELCKTTLLEETLNIDQNTLLCYKDALLSFWDSIPERNYSSE
ncbi:MAG: hypothetical protein DDT19_02857 [Syntrophomonadaceae bacterium]|nr:hypothetical protein [Bacillota bacterium]